MARREFELPSDDVQFLNQYGLPWEAISDGSQWILLHDYKLAERYAQEKVTIAIRIEVGYPNAPLDMMYAYPAITRKDGLPIGATQCNQQIDGKEFQRWSRHRTEQNPWSPTTDDLSTHIFLIEDWLEREFAK